MHVQPEDPALVSDNTPMPFSCAVFFMDYADSPLFHALEDTIRQHNAVVLSLAPRTPGGRTVAEEEEAEAAAAAAAEGEAAQQPGSTKASPDPSRPAIPTKLPAHAPPIAQPSTITLQSDPSAASNAQKNRSVGEPASNQSLSASVNL